ncbi:hypothetical protein [Granulicella sp. dw_53]|uniref:hypothetical protein n=1 Tax=Granulicella sp. dw_53 TaxID=2719792 RepID=UPI001BD22A31|nr:hypothetical protein [Granulicella sp. dw_53]
MAISNRADAINEQRIGIEVYGRSPNYDPAVDGIVRSHATRLRQKLESYFSTEGAHEAMRIEIPRGGYVPRFYTLESEAPRAAEACAEEDALEERPSGFAASDPLEPILLPEALPQNKIFGRQWIRPFLAGLAISAALIAGVLHLRHDSALAAGRSEITQTEIEYRFWSKLFPINGRTLIVSGDSGLVLYETVTGQVVTLSDYIDGVYRDPNRAKTIASEVPQELTFDLASRRYSSFVDLTLSSQLSHLPEWNAERTTTIFARDLRPADAGNSNLILIGSRQANPWVSLIEPSMNFVLAPDGKRGFYFANRHPHDGELKEYIPKPEPGTLGASVVYGDVAYLPNPGGQGMVLSLGGLWITGTQSAGNFVLNGALFSKWLKSIAGSDGSIPPFELLIGTKNLQGNATDSSIIAKRVWGK